VEAPEGPVELGTGIYRTGIVTDQYKKPAI
jgi:hypothetical protein